MDKIDKRAVNYRESTGSQRCGGCSMYRKETPLQGRCTLVAGIIRSDYTCDEWDKR